MLQKTNVVPKNTSTNFIQLLCKRFEKKHEMKTY